MSDYFVFLFVEVLADQFRQRIEGLFGVDSGRLDRNSVPATAANIRIAKILLPSTRSLSLMTSIFDSNLLARLTNMSAGRA